MSVSFSTIQPLNQSTISKMPANTRQGADAAQQPQASSPVYYGQPKKKKSHWFRNTIIAAVLIAGGLAAARQWIPAIKKITTSGTLAKDAPILDKFYHYVAKGGEKIINAGKWIYDGAVKLLNKMKKGTETPPTGSTP